MRIGADPLGLCTRQLNAQQETSQTLGCSMTLENNGKH